MSHEAGYYKLIVLFGGILAVSISYYFLFSLPKHNSEVEKLEASKLDFERQKHVEELRALEVAGLGEQRKKDAADAEAEIKLKKRDEFLARCINQGIEDRNNYMLNNGGVKQDNGLIKATLSVIARAEELEKQHRDNCYQQLAVTSDL